MAIRIRWPVMLETFTSLGALAVMEILGPILLLAALA
jgi:hypothetical protein